MKRAIAGMLVAAAALMAPSALAVSANRFSGAITSATGAYAGDHGRVTIDASGLLARDAGPLAITGPSCGGARHCLALTGRPHATLTLIGRPLPDAGRTLRVRGSGRVNPLGAVTIRGTLRLPGFIRCASSAITVT